jgi:Carboxypeptidase regulatory-like domain
MPTKSRFFIRLFTGLFLFVSHSLFAQNDISGRVLSAYKQPVVGATIQVKGFNVSTLTNADGRFNIHASGKTNELPDTGRICQSERERY